MAASDIRKDINNLEHVLQQMVNEPNTTELHVEQFKRVSRMVDEKKEELKELHGGTVAPEKIPPELVEAFKALQRVGQAPFSGYNILGPPGPVNIAQVFVDTLEWHRATIKVFEYMAAQMHMDLFKDDPKAQKLFNSIMMRGFQAVHNEAQHGG